MISRDTREEYQNKSYYHSVTDLSNASNSNYQKKVLSNNMTTTQLNTLENSLYTLIDKFKKQNKRKVLPFYLSKDVLQDKMDDLVIEGEIINKTNRDKNSYWINEEIADTAIETTVNLLHNFTLEAPNVSPSSSPSHYNNSSSIIPLSLENPAATTKNKQNENIKDTDNLIDETYNQNQAQQLKEEVFVQAEETMNRRFETEFLNVKMKMRKTGFQFI